MAQGTTKGVPIDVDPLLDLNSDLVVPSQKAIKAYVDAKKSQSDSDYVNVSGDTMTGYLTLNGDPTINLHAATKQYVDNYINGLDYKTAAHVGTVAALPAYSVSVNKLVLTGTSNGSIPTATFDNHDPQVGERVLIKNETSTLTPNNGIYVLTQVGSGSLPFILTRADDANTPSKLGEATLSIIYGDTLANTIWHCTPASVPIVIGTTNLTFIQVGSGSVGTGVANELTYWSSTTSLGSLATATYPNLTELSYLKGVTSSIQTQFSNKEDTITTLAVTKGGTGFFSYTVGDLLYADTTTSLAKLAAVDIGSVLISGGVGAAPSWSNSPELRSILLDNSTNANILTLQSGVTSTSYTITLPTAAATGAQYLQSTGAGGTLQWASGTTTGVSSIGTYVNSTGRTNGALISGSVLTFGSATASLPGMVDIAAQTWAGAKTFNAIPVFATGFSLGTSSRDAATTVEVSKTRDINTATPFTGTAIQNTQLNITATTYPGYATIGNVGAGLYYVLSNTGTGSAETNTVGQILTSYNSTQAKTLTGNAVHLRNYNTSFTLTNLTGYFSELLIQGISNPSTVTNTIGYYSIFRSGGNPGTGTVYNFFASRPGVLTSSSSIALTTTISYYAQHAYDSTSNIIDPLGRNLTETATSTTVTNRWSFYASGDKAGFGGGVIIKDSIAVTDALGNTFLNIGASTTTKSHIKLTSGVAPTSPVDGDIWYDGTALKIRIGGTTRTVTVT
jgi:hypothetical protein